MAQAVRHHTEDKARDEFAVPAVVDRNTFQAALDALRLREKAHMNEGDSITAARRRLPMVEVDAATPLIGTHGSVTLLNAFEGRRMLIAYYFMWHTGHSAAEQCEGCTWVTSQVRELSYIHSRDVTFAVFCQGPYEESARYRDLMGWNMKWTTARGVEAMDNSYRLLDLTVYGRQESWEDLPAEWPQQLDAKDERHPRQHGTQFRTNGRPIAQWSRLKAGHSDDIATGGR